MGKRKLKVRQKKNAAARLGIEQQSGRPGGVFVKADTFRGLGAKPFKTGVPYTLAGNWLVPAVNFTISGMLSVEQSQELGIWGGEGRRDLGASELQKYGETLPVPANMIATDSHYATWWHNVDYTLDDYPDVAIKNARTVLHIAKNPVLPVGAAGLLFAGAMVAVKTMHYETFLTVWPLAMAEQKRRGVSADIISRLWLFMPQCYKKHEPFNDDTLLAASFAPYILPVSHETMIPV